MTAAIILAGGSGRRMGTELPKQFLEVGGQTVLCRTIQRFSESDVPDRIIVALPESYLDFAAELTAELAEKDSRIMLTAGGADRNGSILAAIEAGGLSDGDVLITHDAARPFVTAEMIGESTAALDGFDCVSVAVPSTDTVLHSPDGTTVDSVPERGGLFRAQTPQTFRAGDFIRNLSSLTDAERSTVTDACGLFLRCGGRVRMIPGSMNNIKITTPSDMISAEAIAAEEE